jgi:hypothetical protein
MNVLLRMVGALGVISWMTLLSITLASAGALNVTYAKIQDMPERDDYGRQILELALRKSGEEFKLNSSQAAMSQSRAITLIKAGQDVQVAWFGAGPELEDTLLPVRIPMEKGILGYRLFIIDAAKQPLFSAVKTLEDLKKLSAGQGLGWTDIQILENSGITVNPAPFENLFNMLAKGRFDFFPLGANEVFFNAEKFGKPVGNLIVEKEVALVYPFAMYFFVTPGRTDIANAIERGLKIALKDGSFDKILQTHPWLIDAFSKANLAKRRLIKIDNPLLTKRLQNLPKEYFYKP